MASLGEAARGRNTAGNGGRFGRTADRSQALRLPCISTDGPSSSLLADSAQSFVPLAEVFRSVRVPSLVAGLAAADVWVAAWPSGSALHALGVGLRWAAAACVVFLVADVVLALWGADEARVAHSLRRLPDQGERADAPGLAGANPQVSLAAPLQRVTATQVLFLGGALIAAALQRAPSRLVANLLGYGLVAAPLLWVVRRRAGPAAAAKAALALALFAYTPTHLDLHPSEGYAYEQWTAESPFRWSVGWPRDGWILRHEIELPEAARNGPLRLVALLALPYSGPAQVYGTVNGQPVGPLRRHDEHALLLEVPPSVAAGERRLAFELWPEPVDPGLRIGAQRWAAGASRGATASSYFDGERWWLGTFNDRAGRRQEGVYMVRLEGGA